MTAEMAPTVVIGDEEAAWARHLFATMPFGAMAHFRSIKKPGELTVRDVLDDVLRLREVLEEHAASCEQERSELVQLRSDLSAVRRVFGHVVALTGRRGASV